MAQANIETIQTRIDDATLKAPVRGRVLYKLAENGEVLGAGAKALTLVNLEDVYMEIFLPGPVAGQLKVGSEPLLHCRRTASLHRTPSSDFNPCNLLRLFPFKVSGMNGTVQRL